MDLDALATRLAAARARQASRVCLAVRARTRGVTVFEDGRALIKGTSDPAAARSLYHRYIGA